MSKNEYRLLISLSHDPWFNLAVEETIFKSITDQKVLFLWRNDNTVVIGRAQNPWKECNTQKMAEDGIKLARRSSGGGAVFHDLGNTCFTFMAPKPEYDKTISTQIIIDAMNSLGIDVLASGRNDLVVQTPEGIKKISGSAYKETTTSGFHHGTLLIKANLTKLADYLNPDPKKLLAKGITSVKSRVLNLAQLNNSLDHEIISDAIIKAFEAHYHIELTPEYISLENMPNLKDFEKIYENQSSWEWNYGKAPEFTHHLEERFTWGGVDIYLTCNEGRIKEAKVFTDSLYVMPFLNLTSYVINCEYQPNALNNKLEEWLSEFPQEHEILNEFKNWFVNAIA